MTPEPIFSAEEQKAVEALALRRGFSRLREYVLTLVEADAQQHGESLNLAEDEANELGDPAESFRVAWGEAMRGETISYEEFERRMRDDAG